MRDATLQHKVYQHIKDRIMKRQLAPGQHISDTQLAQELQVSRTPIRDGLRRLEHEGFVKSEGGKGWKVYSLTLEDIGEIFEIKIELEGMIARKAANCRDKTKQSRLRKALKRMKDACEANDPEAWRDADLELHEIIFTMCNNERVARYIRALNDQWYRVRVGFVALRGRIKGSTQEHESIVERILEGDAARAETEMRQHLENVKEELERVLVHMVLPFAQNGV